MILAVTLILSGVAMPSENRVMEVQAAEKAVQITSSADLPETIESGVTYELANDIVLSSGQQIASVAGVLDGKGHTVTLADKPLILEVTGTVQNLNVEGDLKSGNLSGTIATMLNGGTIRTSSSKVNIDLGWNQDGGLVGTSIGGKISNSYFAGTATEAFGFVDCGGIIGMSRESHAPSHIKNSLYLSEKMKVVNTGTEYTTEGTVGVIAPDKLASLEGTEILNASIDETGFMWESKEGSLPYLVQAEQSGPSIKETDFTKLNEKLKEVKGLQKEDYTKDTWAKVEEAYKAAEGISANESATQKEVDDALRTLTEAVSSLKKPLPIKAVPLPEDKVISVTSLSDLEAEGTGEGKFYRLENDLTIKEFDGIQNFDNFQGVFDGNGHKVIFENAQRGLFIGIGQKGVVQNVEFTGTLNGKNAPIGNVLHGAVINCLSSVEGSDASGLVKRVAGGVISNCIATGKPGNGGLVGVYGTDNYYEPEISLKNTGKIYHTYWIRNPKDPYILPEDLIGGSRTLTEKEMQSRQIMTTLNENRGDHGIVWGQNGTTGFPYFGEDQNYDPGQTDLPKNKYTVRFGKTKEESEVIKDQKLVVSRNDLTSGNIIGQFFIEGAESKEIEWSVYDVEEEAIDINKQTGDKNNGKLHIYKDGEGIVKAKVKGEDAVWIKVVVKTEAIEEFQLFIDDKDVTNGEYTVEGSKWTTIKVKVKYEGEGKYKEVNSSVFDFQYSGEDLVHNSGSADFYFNRPGTSKVTVVSQGNRSKKATVDVTSNYVPIESIEPDISEKNILHARASMMDGRQFDAIETNGVIIRPENASNKKGFDVSSSNPEVAEFTPTLPLGYLPFKQGETTFTAWINDTNPLTGETRKVEGSRTVSFTYKNPLTGIEAKEKKITVKAYENAPLNLTFQGELSKKGWSVTEPGLNWTYSQDGIVNITREKLHAQNRNEQAPEGEKGYWIATTDYKVTGLKPGTVVATGTPVDPTNNVEPIVLTIKVEAGDAVSTDTAKLAEEGRNAAGTAIEKSHENVSYAFGDEWDVYSLIRAGVTLTDKEKEDYYTSVVNTVQKWDKNQKPTDIERVMLALSAIGKDVKNVGGVNLEEMLLSSKKLTEGSNELTFALIALKTAGSNVPKETIDTLIEELLKFQNQDGGYALFPKGVSGVDTTAMALQALALYRNDEKIEESIQKGLEYIKTQLNPFTFDAGNSEATAQTILALTSLGIDLEKEEGFSNERNNLITALMEYYIEGQGFAHTKNKMEVNKMATSQAFQALEAYRRFLEGEPSYWEIQIEDFTPAPKPEEVPGEKPEQKPEQKPGEKPEQKPDSGSNTDPLPSAVPDVEGFSKEENSSQTPTNQEETMKNMQSKEKESSSQSEEKEELQEVLMDEKGTVTLTKEEGKIRYSIKAVKEDAEKIEKLNLKIKEGSKNKETAHNIKQLTEDAFLFHFNTEKEFGTEVLVEMQTNLDDGDYILMRYNEKEKKLELVQKVKVTDGKTKFVADQGGDYCIAKKASTESVSDVAEESTKYPVLPAAVILGFLAVVVFILLKKKAKKNEK